jgi:hypothetical protein
MCITLGFSCLSSFLSLYLSLFLPSSAITSHYLCIIERKPVPSGKRDELSRFTSRENAAAQSISSPGASVGEFLCRRDVKVSEQVILFSSLHEILKGRIKMYKTRVNV